MDEHQEKAMSAPSHFYPIISRIVAVVLLIAGALKAQEFLTPPASDPKWTVLGQTALELLLGVWLLIGLYPRWSRIAALICFFIFLNVALLGALEGQPSCGCFGKVSVRPWTAVGLDALLLIGLLFSPASRVLELTFLTTRILWIAFAVSTLIVLVVVGLPLARKIDWGGKHIPTTAGDDMPSGIDTTALERVIQGVERNHAALHTLVYTSEKIMTQHPVKWTGPRPMRKGNENVIVTGTWVEPKKEKRSRHAWKTWIRGEEVRQDGLTHYEDGPGGEILLISKGKRIQYAPEIKQAWISTGEFADEGYCNSIDLRCTGFEPPLKSIADWLKNRCKVLNAGFAKDKAGRDVVRVRARVKKHGKIESEVMADFVPSINFMPSRVVYYFLPNGGVLTVTDIEYQQVGPNSAWFPLKIAERSFLRDTTSDPDALTGQNLSEQITIHVLAFAQDVQDEVFDPILPAKTRLLGDLPSEDSTGNVPARASRLTRSTPRTLTDWTPTRQGRNLPTSSWPLAVGMDFLLLGFCLVLRRRLAF